MILDERFEYQSCPGIDGRLAISCKDAIRGILTIQIVFGKIDPS